MSKPFVLALLGALAASAAHADTLFALTTDNQIITLDSAAPTMGHAVHITGLASSERLLGLDTRPTTGLLYTLSNAGRLYTVDATTGQASFVTMLSNNASNASPFMGLIGKNFGVDFNPVADSAGNASLRVISDQGQSLAVNVNVNAANAGKVTVNGNVIAAGTTPAVVSVAYANNVKGATSTTLYGIDDKNDALYTIVPATGAATQVGQLGLSSLSVSAFDISFSGTAYAAMADQDGYSWLFEVNLTPGTSNAAIYKGAFGIDGNTAIPLVVGLSAAAPVPEPASNALLAGGLLAMAAISRRRIRSSVR